MDCLCFSSFVSHFASKHLLTEYFQTGNGVRLRRPLFSLRSHVEYFSWWMEALFWASKSSKKIIQRYSKKHSLLKTSENKWSFVCAAISSVMSRLTFPNDIYVVLEISWNECMSLVWWSFDWGLWLPEETQSCWCLSVCVKVCIIIGSLSGAAAAEEKQTVDSLTPLRVQWFTALKTSRVTYVTHVPE